MMPPLHSRLLETSFQGSAQVHDLIEKPSVGIHARRESVVVTADRGFSGDHAQKDWWKGARVPGREVTAISLEVATTLNVDPCIIGDNLITTGIDLKSLNPGDELHIGSVRLKRSEKDHRPCETFARRVSQEAMLAVRETGTRGALFYVVAGGTLSVGDSITVVRE
ncbi:MAG: MOSC domain-containing protein [Bacteroidetes Order II. Incertae sedis bacterium]|jgi:MOSC domain-containing protein YiiM|nr:MOSC domain-containing protein [Bacteroidetes Order II. bacterium]MBT4052813.1 MOSC domain-containing protein [Bacteroidetes Order II. bacterium]MBT4603055.1 MOSC domain-containing protein [Bacteroidetes Order II. bacterium]MBT5250691.1 MOSC domain-containing protein [Bacteroidetes Order II. bacterium]MBT6201981.1 MOSC domain-containing protein [Bacteroidetes Order II. bacterium]